MLWSSPGWYEGFSETESALKQPKYVINMAGKLVGNETGKLVGKQAGSLVGGYSLGLLVDFKNQ